MPSIMQPSDSDFESTFAALAYARLEDKAPALIRDLLGFQVVDQNDEQNHGVGVMGFKIGEQILFVPSFFLNGEIKQDLIYLKNQSLFVPLQDNWVQYLLNRRPAVLGEPEARSEQELGIQQPNLAPLSGSRAGSAYIASIFGSKIASVKLQPWCDGCEEMFSLIGDRYAQLDTLPQFLQKSAAYGTSRVLARTMRTDFELANKILTQYRLDDLLKCAEDEDTDDEPGKGSEKDKPKHPGQGAGSCRASSASRSSSPSAAVAGGNSGPGINPGISGGAVATPPTPKSGAYREPEILPQSLRRAGIFADTESLLQRSGPHLVSVVHGLQKLALFSDEDAAALARGEVLIKDAREEANVAYKIDATEQLQNPTESGAHRMLLSNGEYRDVFIGLGPKAVGRGFIRVAVVVDKETGSYGYWWPEHIWTEAKEDAKDSDEKYEGLPSASEMRVGKTYVAVSKRRQFSVAFTVRRKDSRIDGTTELFVSPHVSDPGTRPASIPPYTPEQAGQFGDGPDLAFIGETGVAEGNGDAAKTKDTDPMFCDLAHVVLTEDARGLRIAGSTLFVPETSKVIELSDKNTLDSWALSDPASLADVEMNLLKSGELHELNLAKSPEGMFIGGNGPFDTTQTLTFLVKGAGLRGEQAKDLVAAVPMGGQDRVFVKNSIGLTGGFPEPNYGYDDYAGVTEQYPQDEFLPVDMPKPSLEPYLGKPERKQLADAAQMGQKDIFDTSAIASLVKTIDSQDLTSQYLSDIILGLDRVNRILFLFYWRNEQFREHYGNDNIVEMEDQLRNVSKSLGDLVLFLKQRQVEGSPTFDSVDLKLGVS